MALSIDTASDHVELYERLIVFLTSAGPGGPEWEILDEDTGGFCLLRAGGLDGLQQIYFGLSIHASVSEDAYALGVWQFRDYNSLLGPLEQPGTSARVYLPLWNTSMPYWFVANGQRLIPVVKVSTTYQSSHQGKLLPQGVPSEYPQPYYVSAPAAAANIRWSSIDENNRNFFDPGNASYVSTPGLIWKPVWNFFEQSGEQARAQGNFCWPYQSYNSVSGNAAKDRWRELRENIDGTYSRWPIQVLGIDPEPEIYGDIDGCFAATGFNSGSENTVTIDGVPHLVFQNMHRTARYAYALLKLE